MKTFTFPCKTESPTAVALGRFDGVHLAHKAVISAAAQNKAGLIPAVFTFCDNPGKAAHSVLTTQAEKVELIEECGIKLLINSHFETVRNLSAEEFVQQVLCDSLNAKAVYCGYNYRFGKGACADAETLKELCAQRGISVTCTNEIVLSGFSVSSTAVRNLLAEGKVKTAAELLSYNYSLKGNIIHGNALGRTIGTPTLNVKVSKEKQLPLYGVYATLATIDGKVYKSVTNIGLKPTVGSDAPTVETYLLDTQGDFYSKDAKIELVDFIRTEQKFSSLEELRSVINQDVEKAKEILS